MTELDIALIISNILTLFISPWFAHRYESWRINRRWKQYDRYRRNPGSDSYQRFKDNK